MARSVFLFLIFANLAYFVWAQGYLGNGDEGREPQRAAKQLQPDRLKITRNDEAPPAPASPPLACILAGPLAMVDAETLKAAVEEKGAKAIMRPMEEASYWVHIPPLADKATADKKAAELKRMGVADFFVVVEPAAERNAISLGLFHKEDAAQELLQNLTKKGVKSARIEAKPRAAEKARLELRGSADTLAAALKDSAAEVADCPKP